MTNEHLAEMILDLPTAEHDMGSSDSYDNGFRDGFEIGTQHAARLVKEAPQPEVGDVSDVTYDEYPDLGENLHYCVERCQDDGDWSPCKAFRELPEAESYRVLAAANDHWGGQELRIVEVCDVERRRVVRRAVGRSEGT